MTVSTNAREFSIADFGAVGDGVALNTRAFADAVAAAVAAGGGTVRVPPGRYVTGSVRLGSRVTLRVDAGAEVLGSEDPGDYPLLATRWEGREETGHAALIRAEGCEDVAICGAGTIDGRGRGWWTRHRQRALAHPRPRLVQFVNCRNVRIEELTLTNSPAWTVNPVECEDVAVEGLRIRNPPDSPNTDGINPDSCRRVLIRNCRIDVGDDCIAIKSGRGEDGAPAFGACEDIVISNCAFASGHGGVVIGSEMSGGVRRVRVSDCTFSDTDRGIRVKTCRTRGGTVEDVLVSNVAMARVGFPLVMHGYYRFGVPKGRESYAADPAPMPVNAGTPRIRGVRIQGLRATAGTGIVCVYLHGLPEMPIRDVTIADARFEMDPAPQRLEREPAMMAGRPDHPPCGVFAEHVEGLSLERVSLLHRAGPALIAGAVRGLRLSDFSSGPCRTAPGADRPTP